MWLKHNLRLGREETIYTEKYLSYNHKQSVEGQGTTMLECDNVPLHVHAIQIKNMIMYMYM